MSTAMPSAGAGFADRALAPAHAVWVVDLAPENDFAQLLAVGIVVVAVAGALAVVEGRIPAVTVGAAERPRRHFGWTGFEPQVALDVERIIRDRPRLLSVLRERFVILES